MTVTPKSSEETEQRLQDYIADKHRFKIHNKILGIDTTGCLN